MYGIRLSHIFVSNEKPRISNEKPSITSETLDFFSIWIFFKEHSRHTGQQG